MLILVTDIFGETNWSQALIQTWRSQGHNAMCISPYINPYDSLIDVMSFANEEQAYQQFLLSGGMDSYADKLEQALQQITETNEPITCIGFSAGASALWRAAAASFDKIALTHCIGFYPGQIRHSLELTPLCPFTLVFPESEEHFDVESVIQHLVTKQNVAIVQVELKHGYANPQSNNFSDLASRELIALLNNGFRENIDSVDLAIENHQQEFIQRLSQQSHEYIGRTRCL